MNISQNVNSNLSESKKKIFLKQKFLCYYTAGEFPVVPKVFIQE